MAKEKVIKEEVQFIKFIKNLYKDEIQLNFCEYFILNILDNNINLIFPKDPYYRLYGSLNIENADSFKNWLLEKNGSVRINNSELDLLRKIKLSDFLSIDKTQDEYKININPDLNIDFTLKRESPILLNNDYNFEYEKEIPDDFLANNSLFVTSLKNNEIIFSNTCAENEILFDSAIKNFKFIFKKDAQYQFHATKKNENGFRIIRLDGIGKHCQLSQYFKVI